MPTGIFERPAPKLVCAFGHSRHQLPSGKWTCAECRKRNYDRTYASHTAEGQLALSSEGDGYWFDPVRFAIPPWVVEQASRSYKEHAERTRKWRRTGLAEPRFNQELVFDE